jgi:hypothetical protein
MNGNLETEFEEDISYSDKNMIGNSFGRRYQVKQLNMNLEFRKNV